MQPRIKNPATLLPGAMEAIQMLVKIPAQSGVDKKILDLVHLRASQINGCSFCVDYGVRGAKKTGETDQRLFTAAAWREAPWFTDAERAALALAESVTRIADSSDPVPEAIWNEAARHFDEKQLATLVLWIATTNLFNRMNTATRQVAGAWG
jgi:AhpD family alkylhydroperoxidase